MTIQKTVIMLDEDNSEAQKVGLMKDFMRTVTLEESDYLIMDALSQAALQG